jgi:hypothetical protein
LNNKLTKQGSKASHPSKRTKACKTERRRSLKSRAELQIDNYVQAFEDFKRRKTI